MQSPHNVRKQQTAPRLACRVVVLLLTAAAGFPAAAAADGEQTASRGTVRTQPDFLFERPSVSVSLRGIWNRARAESDFYEFVHEELFVRRDADEDSWAWITPVLSAWQASEQRWLPQYDAGSWGPVEADRLIATSGATWRTL